MVFESLVADLLNRFLGDFVDNLDSSQLNIGIWGGDVKLDNLEVKESALDDFDLPIKLKYGYLESLVLKIPWKNLYNEPVIATIDGLYLIAVPNKGVVYNEEKAKKTAAEIKQKTLARLEEARKNRRKPADPQADTFAEKMVTQIIKNLQISISNIHVRYEDKYTNRHRPFVAGCTLEKLDFTTTNDEWIPTIHKEAVKIIHKLVSLDNLAVYWNSKAELISDLTDKAAIRHKLKATIHNGRQKPDGYKYILEPIKMEAKLKLNQKPETDGTDWKTPKIDLAVDMQALALAIGKLQYQDVLLFLEAQERFNLAGQYLKYRPHLNEYKGHYKEWWHFAYKAILEEKVRRRRHNWSWERMKRHRHLVRDYRDAWILHQTQKSPPSNVAKTVKEAEEKLDVFNVNVARQQAEMEIDRQGLTRLEDQPQGWIAWGKSWFGGGGGGAAKPKEPEKKKVTGTDIASQFQEAMTEEEKAKLFEAIDYQENIPPTNYPKEFIENKFDFKLRQVSIVIDGAIALQLLQLKAQVEQRPSAAAMNVVSSIQELRMDGCGAEMLRVRDPTRAWLSLFFDSKPLSGEYDQKVQLSIAPVNLKYHAPAVNGAIDVFKPPESVKLNQLTALAMSKYDEVKARSVTGLAHAVENKSKLILDICIEPATLMVSEGGIYKPELPTILADLGRLTVKTVDEADRHEQKGKSKMETLTEQAYDKFQVQLSNVVVSFAEDYKKAHDALSLKESPLHILKPTGLRIQIHKSAIDDLLLPKMKIVGDLPDIVVGISDTRLLMLMKLLNSIPKPEIEPEIVVEEAAPVEPVAKLKDRAKMRTIMETEEVDDVIEKAHAAHATKEEREREKDQEKEKSTNYEQQVQVELDLKLNQIGLVVFRKDQKLCDVSINRMSCKLQMRTFDMVVTAELGAVQISMPIFKSLDPNRKHLYLIDNDEQEGVLMKLKFVQANPESPFFESDYQRTEQTVDFQFSRLNVCLHQEGLMELKQFGEKLQAEMAKLEPEKPATEKPPEKKESLEQRGRKISRAISDSIESLTSVAKTSQSEAAAEKRKARKERAMVETDPTIFKMRLEARIGSLAVLLGTEKAGLDTKFAIQTVTASVGMTIKSTDVQAALQAITIEDCTPNSAYRKLMSVSGDKEMLKFEMTQYQRTEAEKAAMLTSDTDMKVKVRLAQMRFVFLNLWVARLLHWLGPFQEEAQKAAAAAQQAASEKAAEAAQNVKQILETSPPRIELDVELEAPMIVVPRLSSSRDVIVALLGNISLKNKITGHKEDKKAIIDKMEIHLTEMSLGIGAMDESGNEVKSTCEILKPLTFTLHCHRNLSFAKVKSIPETTVNAKIGAIEMNMSEQDYATIMQTLSGNLAEGKEELTPHNVEAALVEGEAPPPTSEPSEDDETTETGSKKKKTTSPSTAPKKSTAVTPADREATTGPITNFNKIVFQFTLEKIVAVLYTGGTEHGAVRKAEDAFAAMRLQDLKLSGLIKEDETLDVSMSLTSFTMDDERRNSTKIHRLMDKKPGHENDQFLSLRFSQNREMDRNVAIKMAAFFICLCPEFLGCLSRFFAVPPTEEQLEKSQAVPVKSASSGGSSALTKTPPPVAPPGTLTIDCTMHGIEVLLVENSMNPETTQALILTFNVTLDAKPSDKVTTMKGGVEKLAIFSSYYAPKRRHEVTYEVLKPMDIGIEVTMDSTTKGCDAVLRMSPMEVKMSPSVIRLLSSVNAEFAKSSAVESSSGQSSAFRMKSYPNYWGKKGIDKKKFWFLTVPTAEEGTECTEEDVESPAEAITSLPPPETAKVLMEKISFTLEAGTGVIPVPMMFLDLYVNAEATNWSSALKATADVSLQMSYYNEAFSVWEPVIEPFEVSTEKFERWNLRATVKGRNKLDATDTSPGMDVKIETDKILNVTVTKSFLNLLTQLSEVFEQAAKQITPPTTRQLTGSSPFVLLNETGVIVKVHETDSISLPRSNGQPVDATHGEFVELALKNDTTKSGHRLTAQNCLEINHEELQALLRLDILDSVRELTIGRAEKRSIPLGKRSEAGKQWKIVAETSIENGRRLIALTSHVHVTNHLDVPMELYAKRETTLDLFGCVQPGASLPLPVPLLYTQTGEIYFKPANDKCEVSFESLSWHFFENEPCKRQAIRCDLSSDLSQGYFFETALQTEDVIESTERTGHLHTIHLWPPLQFHNNLPFPVTLEQPVAQDLLPGDSVQLNIISGCKLKLWASHLGEMYCLDMEIPREKKDVDVVALNTETGSAELLLGLNWSHEHGDQKVYLFAPFWLVNNTSLPLRHAVLVERTSKDYITESGGGFISSARGCVSCHKTPQTADELESTVRHLPEDNPLILPFPTTDLSKKKKGKVQVEGLSEWSDEIPLDVVGNPSRVICRANDRDYELTVDIKLCQSGLTKVVTFTPFYLVSNLSRGDIQVREDKHDEWVDIPAEKCVGVWPRNRAKKKLYTARYTDGKAESLLFPIAENLETLCQIEGDAAGIHISVSTGEGSVAIHLAIFQPGMAPVCVMNCTKSNVRFRQKGHRTFELGKQEMAYFTWASLVDDRIVELECGDWKGEDKLMMNRLVDVKYNKDSRKVYYMTNFLVGRQRTILFTDDLDVAKAAYGAWDTDNVDLQAEIALQGIGLSIVDNLAGKEILYIGISSSDILWEEEVKKGRFKPFAVKHMEQLEEKYQQHLVQPNHEYQQLDQFEVNLDYMIVKKKKGKEVKIRRTFEKGIWMNYGQNVQRKRLHFKLNHLQCDNQLDACLFPRVLAVVPPPKSVVADNAPKPFIELSLLQRLSEFSTVPEIEYARVLVQEFAVSVDIGLLNSLMELVSSRGQSKPYGKEMFDQDMEMANVKLEDQAQLYKAMRPKSFYNDLHISPLMIHLSFSQGGMTDEGGIAIQSEFINLFIKSVGVSLTEIQDVVFRLAFFERKCVFYSQDQLNAEIVSHYTKQFMKQLYVLVFGLDIIGNPFGLVRDLSAGVEDLFYQPFQGLVQGPEEFIQGVGIGVQSMFGHALGGAAGAVGRITGTVGKGVAALTFDQDYQRKRQEDINRKPQSFGEGMARGMKGLGMGLVDGVTGIVTKPAEGLRQEGAKGLFKGVGKGLIGVVARPVSGVVDFASGTMDAVKTVAGSNRDAAPLRPPRVIREDKIVRPFSQTEAVGFKIYKDTNRGAIAETDEFVCYAPITNKIALLVTDRQLVLTKRADVMGTWAVDWQTEYSKICEPSFVPNGIKVLFKEKKKGFLGMGASDGKIITFPNAEVTDPSGQRPPDPFQAIQQKVLAAYRASTSS